MSCHFNPFSFILLQEGFCTADMWLLFFSTVAFVWSKVRNWKSSCFRLLCCTFGLKTVLSTVRRNELSRSTIKNWMLEITWYFFFEQMQINDPCHNSAKIHFTAVFPNLWSLLYTKVWTNLLHILLILLVSF